MYINSSIPWLNDRDKFIKLVEMNYKVGYQAAIIEFLDINDYNSFIKSDFFPKREDIELNFPITVADIKTLKVDLLPFPLIPEITIESEKSNILKQKLGKIIQKDAIYAVRSSIPSVLEIAARDGRVDLIKLSSQSYIEAISPGIISLSKQNRCYFDLNITKIIASKHVHRTRILRSFHKLFQIGNPFNTRYILGSHDSILQNPWLLRGPHEIIAIIHTFFNIPYNQAKNMVRQNSETLILRYLKRISKAFIEPGIEIVEEKMEVEHNEKK